MKTRLLIISVLAVFAVSCKQSAPVEENPLAEISNNPGLCGIFHHWGFIGDSLSSGEFEYTPPGGGYGYWDCYEYSWGKRMCAYMGVEGENYSVGGETAMGWIQHFWDKAKTEPKQAYIIALGVNDSSPYFHDKNYPLGNFSTDVNFQDYTSNAVSFAGCYAGIIQRLKEIQPEVKIFVVTIPEKDDERYGGYNDMIRQMSERFAEVYLIDLHKYAADYYATEEFKALYVPENHGHLTAAGYEYTAAEFLTYIDWIIRHNMTAFKEVGFMLEGAPVREKQL